MATKPEPTPPPTAPTGEHPWADLTPEEIADLHASCDEVERGETISLDDALAEIDAELVAAAAVRTRKR